jgi:arginine decarboxylase
MDQNAAPILDGPDEYHRVGRCGLTPPGHRQSRGADQRPLDVLGKDTYPSDVLATAGLDDRSSSGGHRTRTP